MNRIFLNAIHPFFVSVRLYLNEPLNFMNKTNFPYALKHFSYFVLICLGTAQNLAAQTDQPDYASNQKATMLNVVRNLEQKHVLPKTIDDDFSKVIWKKFLEGLDPNKDIFLKSDFQKLKSYELNLDDELHAGSSEFFNAAYQLYQERLAAAATGYKKLLAAPLDLQKKESVQLNGSLLEYAATQTELNKIWSKRIKYMVLKKMLDLDKNKMNDPVLEKEARAKMDKWLTNVFKNLQGPLAMNEKFSRYMNIVTLEMDAHTSYLAPVDAQNFNNQMARRFYGVGLELQDKEGDIFVKSLRPGGMALKSGLIDINDRILSISDPGGNMVEVAGLPILEVANLIRGDQGTEVALNLLKTNGQEKRVSLKREEIKEQEGRARSVIMEKNGQKIGYIYLPQFYVDMTNPLGIRSSQDVYKEILKLKAENVKGIVFDLRNNGGGSLEEVIAMTGFFLGTGPKVQVRDQKVLRIRNYFSEPIYTGPLLVMVNEQSASASEIFAAAIQDYKRGLIVGSAATYGKGTAQIFQPMGKMGDKINGTPNTSYGSLQLTMHRFYRVSGASTQLKGVLSDVTMPGKLAYQKIREKDNPTAMAWDSIPALEHKIFNQPEAWMQMVNLAKESVGQTEAFKIINENSKLLAELQLAPVSLKLTDFIKQQRLMLDCTQIIDKMAKLPETKKLTVRNLPGYSADQENDWYQKWIEVLETDLYLDKTIDMMAKTISVN